MEYRGIDMKTILVLTGLFFGFYVASIQLKSAKGTIRSAAERQNCLKTMEATQWSNLTCVEDALHADMLMHEPVNLVGGTPANFYQVIMRPVQSACTVLKKIGGSWYGGVFYDGIKYVCFDDIMVSSSPCLVYSFGIGHDISFEILMTKLGCTVHAYDHTIPETMKSLEDSNRNLHIHFKGINTVTTDVFTTLEAEFVKHGHSNAVISYLKADIEGGELEVVPNWLASGILNRVQQISLEFHNIQLSGARYFSLMQELYKQGFKLISFDPNYFAGTMPDKLHHYIDVVFRKVNSPCNFDD